MPSAIILSPPMPEKTSGRVERFFSERMRCAPSKSPDASPAIRYTCSGRSVMRHPDNEDAAGIGGGNSLFAFQDQPTACLDGDAAQPRRLYLLDGCYSDGW